MLLSEIYTNVHTRSSKDGNEGLIAMNRWNSLLPSWQQQYVKSKIEENYTLTPGGLSQPKTKYSSKQIAELIETATESVGSGYFSITAADFMYWKAAHTSSEYNEATREIQLVSEEELNSRIANLMGKPLTEYPVCVQRGDDFYVYPTDVSSVIVSYIKEPSDPFLDYYIDADYKLQFLTEGGSHTLGASEQYRDGTTSGIKSSITNELDIPASMHPEFEEYIVATLNEMLGDINAEQMSMAKIQKEESV